MSVSTKVGRVVPADDHAGYVFVVDGKVSVIGGSSDLRADEKIGAVSPHARPGMPPGAGRFVKHACFGEGPR